jgi:hypothetical protein
MSSQKDSYNNSISQESNVEVSNKGVTITGTATGIDKNRFGGNYQAKSLRESNLMEEKLYSKKYNLDTNPFYYDQQLKDKRLTITLHPNAKYAGGEWIPFNFEECFDTNVLKTNEDTKDNPYLYRIKPIATAIAAEDFVVNVSNSWTEFGRTNAIEEMYNSIKPYAGTVAALADSGIGDVIGNYDYSKSDSVVVQGIGKVVGMAKKLGDSVGLKGGLDQLGDMLNRQLTVQGTRFAYFSGSTSSFGNLSMKFTVFSDWILDGNDYRFVTCYEQLEELYDYSMSKYKSVSGDEGIAGMLTDLSGKAAQTLIGGNTKDKHGNTVTTGEAVKQQASDFIERHFKWQMPPGGFRADLKNIDNVQRGTLKLRINDMYTLENLIITSMNISYSRIPCKHPLESERGKIIPLYADVMISLQPATMYTDTALRAFVEGKTWSTINAEKDMRDDLLTGAYSTIFTEIKES